MGRWSELADLLWWIPRSQSETWEPNFLPGVLRYPAASCLARSRGAHHGFDERDAQAAFFEFEDAVDGAAGGSGYGVFEQRRMVAGFEHHFCRAESGLRGELGGGVAGQADLYAGFGEGLDDDVDVGRAGGREAGDGVHVLLVDDDGAAHGLEDALRQFHLLGRDEAPAAEAGGAGAESRRRVGHGANDGDVDPGRVFNGACLDRCGERDRGSCLGQRGLESRRSGPAPGRALRRSESGRPGWRRQGCRC